MEISTTTKKEIFQNNKHILHFQLETLVYGNEAHQGRF